MSFLNAHIPNLKVWIRNEFLQNFEAGFNETTPAIWYGIKSRPGNVLACHVLTERGALYDGVPLHGLLWREPEGTHGIGDHQIEARELVLWDCYSYDVSVTEYSLLSGLRCRYRAASGKWLPGQLWVTLDWTHPVSSTFTDPGWSEIPEEHKTGNLILLDDGRIAMQPNNRVLVEEPSFVVNPYDVEGGEIPELKRNHRDWSVERGWRTSDNEDMFYGIEKS
jgi:hypothetical protein